MKQLIPFLALLLCSCAATEELMIGQGRGLDAPAGTKIPNNPALVAAMAGNKVYRTRHIYLGGDHIVKTSSGSEYNHALTASFKDFLQAMGVAVIGWTQASVAKAKEVSTQFEAGQITKREAQAQMAAIQQAEIAAKGSATSEAIKAGAEIAPLQVTTP
jgi:hypothetical protein